MAASIQGECVSPSFLRLTANGKLSTSSLGSGRVVFLRSPLATTNVARQPLPAPPHSHSISIGNLLQDLFLYPGEAHA